MPVTDPAGEAGAAVRRHATRHVVSRHGNGRVVVMVYPLRRLDRCPRRGDLQDIPGSGSSSRQGGAGSMKQGLGISQNRGFAFAGVSGSRKIEIEIEIEIEIGIGDWGV
jgi:hypothetical protein